ncbi:MAG: DUF2779 domain-containing protein [Candidatus Woesearchaeota archaeon]
MDTTKSDFSRNILSKTDFKLGLECEYALWYTYHNDEIQEELSKDAQFRIDEGIEVGELAQTYFQDGVLVEKNVHFEEYLKLEKTLFEAPLRNSQYYARVDILRKNEDSRNSFDIIEVKSSTSLKDEHVYDCAFQLYVAKSLGITINNVYVMYLNNEYVKEGEIDVNELFILEEVTLRCLELLEEVEEKSTWFYELINFLSYSSFRAKYHTCKGFKHCPIPKIHYDNFKEHNVFELYRGGKKCNVLYEEYNVTHIDEITHEMIEELTLNEKQQIQIRSVKNREEYINPFMILNFLDSLQYPLYFVDFETYTTAIPLHNGLKPFQRVPFQFSLHIISHKGAKPEHYEFLASGKNDPREEFISTLQSYMNTTQDTKGSIIVYNEGFEKGVLKELSDFNSKYKDFVLSLNPRFVDLLVVFRNFWYHHYNQRGSCSIKAVLPCLVPHKKYSDLEISNGSDASLEYFYSIFKYQDEEKIAKLREDLLKYCELDTQAMIDILYALEEKCNN